MSDQFIDLDPSASERKKDHIELAFKSQIRESMLDSRFYYEPILSGHPSNTLLPSFTLGSKVISTPIWVSSMTGGTEMASIINRNLARACSEFGMGMGLGSCRSLLKDDTYLGDFAVRKLIGDQPLYANLGIAQIEKLYLENKLGMISSLLNKLEADGLIVHINPLQEWLQPEGDIYFTPPLELIERLLDVTSFHIIVKEVGHGMGIESLTSLMKLPLAGIEFAANGGTNFSKIELSRSDELRQEAYGDIAYLGHSALEMTNFVNQIIENESDIQCSNFIISGGVKSFLDGYYLLNKIKAPAIYGQASAFLKHARGDYEALAEYITLQISGLGLAYSFLKVKS